MILLDEFANFSIFSDVFLVIGLPECSLFWADARPSLKCVFFSKTRVQPNECSPKAWGSISKDSVKDFASFKQNFIQACWSNLLPNVKITKPFHCNIIKPRVIPEHEYIAWSLFASLIHSAGYQINCVRVPVQLHHVQFGNYLIPHFTHICLHTRTYIHMNMPSHMPAHMQTYSFRRENFIITGRTSKDSNWKTWL